MENVYVELDKYEMFTRRFAFNEKPISDDESVNEMEDVGDFMVLTQFPEPSQEYQENQIDSVVKDYNSNQDGLNEMDSDEGDRVTTPEKDNEKSVKNQESDMILYSEQPNTQASENIVEIHEIGNEMDSISQPEKNYEQPTVNTKENDETNTILPHHPANLSFITSMLSFDHDYPEEEEEFEPDNYKKDIEKLMEKVIETKHRKQLIEKYISTIQHNLNLLNQLEEKFQRLNKDMNQLKTSKQQRQIIMTQLQSKKNQSNSWPHPLTILVPTVPLRNTPPSQDVIELKNRMKNYEDM